jgi:hypothetical protein
VPTTFGALRRLIMTPSLAKVSFAGRGFAVGPSAAAERLEAIPQAVVCGFEWGIDARDQWEVERRLTMVEPELRGFAYEGVTMAFTILDAMGPGRGHRTRDLLIGPGQPHIFLAYIGIGFAMARLPRLLWKKVIPDLEGSAYYPTMSWLAVDGFGFDRAYFDTASWVERQHVPRPYPWEGSPDYFLRAVDQGIGRALWFIHGAQVPDIATTVGRFASHRHADLWSGVGLAAAFAGACTPEGLSGLRRASGEHQADLAQGAVFAVKARAFSGVIPPHCEVAARALAGISVDAAVALADDSAVEPGNHAAVPAYELWRRRVRTHFLSSAGILNADRERS